QLERRRSLGVALLRARRGRLPQRRDLLAQPPDLRLELRDAPAVAAGRGGPPRANHLLAPGLRRRLLLRPRLRLPRPSLLRRRLRHRSLSRPDHGAPVAPARVEAPFPPPAQEEQPQASARANSVSLRNVSGVSRPARG